MNRIPPRSSPHLPHRIRRSHSATTRIVEKTKDNVNYDFLFDCELVVGPDALTNLCAAQIYAKRNLMAQLKLRLVPIYVDVDDLCST